MMRHALQTCGVLGLLTLTACGGAPQQTQLDLGAAPSPTVGTLALASYYVDCSASSNGTGTSASPWNSLATVNARIFAAGSQIYLKRGTLCAGHLEPSGSGSSAEGNVIATYGSGAAPIIATAGTAEAAVILRNVGDWTVQDLELTNTASAEAQRSGVLLEVNTSAVYSNVTIKNLNIHDVKGISDRNAPGRYSSAGILVRVPAKGSSATGSFADVTIDSNTIHDLSSMGIASIGGEGEDTNTRITGLVVRNNVISKSGADGIVVGVSTSPLIERNISYDAGTNAINRAYIAGIWGFTSSNPVFQYNEAARILPSGDSQAWDCDWGITGSCTYQYNYSHDNSGGFFLECLSCAGPAQTDTPNVIVRYNVSQNDAGCGINKVNNASVFFNMYNNVLYCPTGALNWTLPSNSVLRNNIIVAQSGTLPGATYTANLYRGLTPPPGDALAQTSDPLFTAPGTGGDGISTATGYRLQSGSPALGTGTTISSPGSQDFYGNAVPGGDVNIGAYQGSAVTAPAPVPSVTLANGSFEQGTSGWSPYGGATTSNVKVYTGLLAGVTGPSNSGLDQTISGLKPDTSYTLSGYTAVQNAGETVYFGVKDYGGNELFQDVSSNTYVQNTLLFTTGSANTSATAYCYKGTGSGAGYCDDYTLTPLLSNGDFEQGLANWTPNGGAQVTSTSGASGTYALMLPGSYSGADNYLANLQPNTTYVLSGAGKVLEAGEQVAIGVKNYGGTEQAVYFNATSFSRQSITFTTGSTNTSAQIYCYRGGSGNNPAFCDDLRLKTQ